MSYDRLLKEIESLKRKVERLQAMDAPQAFNPAVLDDYLLEADAALLYLGKNDKANDSDKLDGLDSTAFLGVNAKAADSNRLNGQMASYYSPAHSHPYLGVNDTAQDSNKLGGVAASGYVKNTGDENIDGVKTFLKLPTLPTATPTTNQPTRLGYADATYLKKPTWTSYTPTVAYEGGTTDPTGLTINYAKYFQIEKMVTLSIKGTLNRGSGNRTYILFSLPQNTTAFDAAGTGFESVVSNHRTPRAVYISATNRVCIYLQSQMAQDGVVSLSITYEAE